MSAAPLVSSREAARIYPRELVRLLAAAFAVGVGPVGYLVWRVLL